MTKSSFGRFTGVVALLAFGAEHASAQRVVEAPSFRPNSYWVYDIHSHSEQGDYALRLQWTLLYLNRDGNWVFARGKPDAEGSPNAVKQITGVTDVAWSGRDSSGPQGRESSLLSFPLAAGKTWYSHFTKSDGADVQCEHRAIEWERITTPPGTFEALRIEYRCARVRDGSASSSPRDEMVTVTHWYAPTVQNFVRENMRFPGGGYSMFELQSYSLAK